MQKDSIALVIENGSTLDCTGRGTLVEGGKLATQAVNVMGDQPPAIIKAGLYFWNGTEIKISDTAYNPTGVTGHKFGQLKIEGDITWHAGTYRPVVDGTAGSDKADLWWCTGAFTVYGKDDGSFAKIAPESINNPAGGIVGRSWTVMHSDDKVTWVAGEEAPKLPAGWVNDSLQDAKDWKVKYTG